MNGVAILDFEFATEYKPFTDEIRKLILSGEACEQKALGLQGDEASLAVGKLISHVSRSQHGIFFTPSHIGDLIVTLALDDIEDDCSFYDPACGAGNLLLRVAREYKIKESLEATVAFWGEKFGGCDIHAEFVYAAKLRLVHLAAYRHGFPNISEKRLDELVKLFHKFQVGDYIKRGLGSDFDCIIANPPFGHVIVDDGCKWSSGRTQLAAIFFDEMVKRGKAGQKIIAILPDVLRSGTRYDRWRSFVSSELVSVTVHSYGRFARDVDVDVFILQAQVGGDTATENIQWVSALEEAGDQTIGSLFSVKVGTVVPFRLDGKGSWAPYLTSKNCPSGGEVRLAKKIRFKGTKFTSPFLVIRRTSNPSDRNRIVVTLVDFDEPVAVENHLIVLKPLDGCVDTCRELMEFLSTAAALDQLNQRIRCRHLTTRSIMELKI